MAIRKKISNESLIPSSWIRWIILCEELTRSKIDTEETCYEEYVIERDLSKYKKGEYPYETPNEILLEFHYDYKQIIFKEFRTICCSPIEMIPPIQSPEKAQDELIFLLQRMKKSTEEALNIVGVSDAK